MLVKLLRHPKRYLPRIPKVLLGYCAPVFQNSGFFLQGQMDIHPAARWPANVKAGFSPQGEQREVRNLDPWDNTRRDMLVLLLRTILERGVAGDFAEVGVYKGWTARLIHCYAPERTLHLFDTFEGFTERSHRAEMASVGTSALAFSDTSLEAVRTLVGEVNVHYHVGFFPQTVPPELHDRQFAFVHLDADLYEPIKAGLEFFYPRMCPRGMIVVHDYNSWPGARRAVDEFFCGLPELPIPMPDKSGSALIVRS